MLEVEGYTSRVWQSCFRMDFFIQVTQALKWMFHMTIELEANIVAVERTKEYAEAPNEV